MKNLINVLLYVLLALLVVTISVMIYKKFKTPADTQSSGETTEQTYSDTSNTQALPFSAEDSIVLGLTGELPNQVGPEAESNTVSTAQVNVSPVAKPVANHETVAKTENTKTNNTELITKTNESKSAATSAATMHTSKKEDKHEMNKVSKKDSKVMVKKSSQNSTQKVEKAAESKGHYYVVSGSFLVPSNAEKQVNKLKKLGFFNASKKIFSNSSSYSAVAGQYDTEAAARASLSKLKSKGEEGFIKKN